MLICHKNIDHTSKIEFDSIVGETYVYCGPLVLHLPKTEGREDISFAAHGQRGVRFDRQRVDSTGCDSRPSRSCVTRLGSRGANLTWACTGRPAEATHLAPLPPLLGSGSGSADKTSHGARGVRARSRPSRRTTSNNTTA
jgi:hypothetical protein